jgi:Holliday junction resolvasome RuvABC DNA-binding subunit
MDVSAKLVSALQNLGFRRPEVTRVLAELPEAHSEPKLEVLVRAALLRLTPLSA